VSSLPAQLASLRATGTASRQEQPSSDALQVPGQLRWLLRQEQDAFPGRAWNSLSSMPDDDYDLDYFFAMHTMFLMFDT
jgi:hypothetical protein